MACCAGGFGVGVGVRNTPLTKSLCERAIYGSGRRRERAASRAKKTRTDRDGGGGGNCCMGSPPLRPKTKSYPVANRSNKDGFEAICRPSPVAACARLIRAVTPSNSQASALSATSPASTSTSPSRATPVAGRFRSRTDSASPSLHFARAFAADCTNRTASASNSTAVARRLLPFPLFCFSCLVLSNVL